MKSIMATYPGFQALPRGVKRLLLVSENFFFNDAVTPAVKSGTSRLVHVHPWVPPSAPGDLERNGDDSPVERSAFVQLA